MQNTLLILGNGFDLECGLKSSFTEFFNACIKDKVSILKEYGDHKVEADGFWQALLYIYEWKYNQNDYNWFDIEDIIKNTLLNVFIENLNKKSFYEQAKYDIINDVNNDYNMRKVGMDEYIKSYCKPFIVRKCGYKNKFANYEEIKKDFAIDLLFQLKILENQFCKYMNGQLVKKEIIGGQSTFKKNEVYFSKAVKLLNNLVPMIKDKHGDMFISILNFNYTYPINNELKCKIINVHGQLCNKICSQNAICLDSNIIFGIDDTVISDSKDGIIKNDIKIFSKTYRTLLMSNNAQKILPSKGSKLVIKFFGHSLNKADYSYFQSIFDYYDIYNNSNVSLEFIYNGEERKNSSTERVYNLISDYGAKFTNKDQGKNLMHKLLLEKRISINSLAY
ncbi:MAG: AbiH family protein [Firmicutes bacterium]|nr:AbiH family protein [Bacillota bacterium]